MHFSLTINVYLDDIYLQSCLTFGAVKLHESVSKKYIE